MRRGNFPIFNELLKIAQILLDSLGETWRIEDRTDFQCHFRILLRLGLERNHARHETLGHCAPRYPATGNLEHDVENPLLLGAIGMPRIRKMRVINSSHFPQRGNKLRQVLDTRPLLIDPLERRLHNNELLGGVHSWLSRVHRFYQLVRWRSEHIPPWKKRDSIRL